MLKNTENRYGIVAIALHWLMAIAIIGTFILGLWMVDMDYGHEWYISAPNFHRSLGVLILFALIFRFIWRLVNVLPKADPGLKKWQIYSSHFVHYLIYILVVIIALTGYLISTADGRAIDVFGLFEVPATITNIKDQADRSGDLHYYLGIFLMVLAGIHAFAALKHHFVDKDKTLSRMLGKQ